MPRRTILLVFIHGFKGGEHTFHKFPHDLRALLHHALPRVDVLSAVYPPFETRGDLKECVGRFTEWLQNKVIDLEAANRTPSPTLRPSVHVVLCGHSMGGIVAAETLLKVAREDVSLPRDFASDNSTQTAADEHGKEAPVSAFFPRIQAIIAFDTPYLGISPGVLAHGAEEHINNASDAYKAFSAASSFFGKSSPAASGTASPIAGASAKALPAAEGSAGWGKWGKFAAVGGAAAAIAGAAGAAYLNRDQISQGIAWAGSHLEFVGCLARGAELQQRVERVVEVSRIHHVGFANFYGALDEKVSSKTKYAGAVLGDDRTFCVVPRQSGNTGSPTGTKRSAPAPASDSARTKRSKDGPDGASKTKDAAPNAEAGKEGEQVQNFAADPSRSKGRWVKCVNTAATDEVRAHTSMFTPQRNPDYHSMLPRARDQIVEWIDKEWYDGSDDGNADTSGSRGAAAGRDEERSGDESADELAEES